VPIDLDGVCFATANSSKGVASFPGLAMVFHHHRVASSPRLPRYLDLGVYTADNVPYTTSSNLIRALARAVDRFRCRVDGDGGPPSFAQRRGLARWLRGQLAAAGWRILAPETVSSPAVFSLVVPKSTSSLVLGESLESEGYFTSYRSRYLLERNLLQICLMSSHSQEELEPLLAALNQQASELQPTV